MQEKQRRESKRIVPTDSGERGRPASAVLVSQPEIMGDRVQFRIP